jgi:RNA polymerase sigma-70 factor (ECF subfamily)
MPGALKGCGADWKSADACLSAIDDQERDCRFLLLQVADKEERAFEALYNQYGRIVQGMAFRLLAEPHEAEEVMQDVFLELWRRPPTAISGSPSLLAWLAQVTRTRCWRALRRKQEHIRIDESVEEAVAYSDPCFSHIVKEQLRARVESAFLHVAGDERAILELTWFRGLGAAEISRRLGLPLITVRRHVEGVALRLRRRLAAST